MDASAVGNAIASVLTLKGNRTDSADKRAIFICAILQPIQEFDMARPRAYELKGYYGQFNKTKVYYLGFAKQPKFLGKNGRGFAGLKHILELLKAKYPKFTLTFTPAESSVTKVGKEYRVRLAAPAITRLHSARFDANRDLNLRLGRSLLATQLPGSFNSSTPLHVFKKGMFADILNEKFDPRLLNDDDRRALTKFVTGTLASAGGKGIDRTTAYETAKDVQLIYLKNLIAEFEGELDGGHDENWWQVYFEKNILFFQESYIRYLSKVNIVVAATRFPDFAVITSDDYLDILDIKRPDTQLLREDASRHNFYWSPEIAKAISQVENYIDDVTKNADAIRSALRDQHGIDLRIIKPRGIVIAGRTSEFAGNTKRADDFRRLNGGLKNVQIIPYDDLSQRLHNTVTSIERLTTVKSEVRKRRPRDLANRHW